MYRTISSQPDIFCLYYESVVAPNPKFENGLLKPNTLFKLFYKKSKSAFRRQLTTGKLDS